MKSNDNSFYSFLIGSLFLKNSVCVDGLLKHVFYSNHKSQSSLDEKKIGQFRLRKKQLEQLDVKLCEVIDMEFGFMNKHKRFDFLRELIVSTASSKDEK